ncbi:hypothetical protein BJY52DRAFT_1283614 [Lactarius psammicola]|nr:hypothetical protein BJY52DRAFT_1283614 [Lactarius psammicola]
MFHYSCSFPVWLCSFATLISQSSSWCCHGLAFARPCTDASRSSQSFVMIARITPHSHCRCGTLAKGETFDGIDGIVGAHVLI